MLKQILTLGKWSARKEFTSPQITTARTVRSARISKVTRARTFISAFVIIITIIFQCTNSYMDITNNYRSKNVIFRLIIYEAAGLVIICSFWKIIVAVATLWNRNYKINVLFGIVVLHNARAYNIITCMSIILLFSVVFNNTYYWTPFRYYTENPLTYM